MQQILKTKMNVDPSKTPEPALAHMAPAAQGGVLTKWQAARAWRGQETRPNAGYETAWSHSRKAWTALASARGHVPPGAPCHAEPLVTLSRAAAARYPTRPSTPAQAAPGARADPFPFLPASCGTARLFLYSAAGWQAPALGGSAVRGSCALRSNAAALRASELILLATRTGMKNPARGLQHARLQMSMWPLSLILSVDYLTRRNYRDQPASGLSGPWLFIPGALSRRAGPLAARVPSCGEAFLRRAACACMWPLTRSAPFPFHSPCNIFSCVGPVPLRSKRHGVLLGVACCNSARAHHA